MMTEHTYHIKRQATKNKGTAVYLHVTIKGTKYRPLLGHNLTEEEADRRAIQKIHTFHLGGQQKPQPALAVLPNQAFTLMDGWRLYLDVSENKGLLDVKRSKSILENHFIPFFGEGRELDSLGAEDGLRYLTHRKKNGKAKPGTTAKEWGLLLRIMNIAEGYEKITRNRLRVIDKPKGDRRKRVATLDELDEIRKVAMPFLWRYIVACLHAPFRESMVLSIADTWFTPQEDGWWLTTPKAKSTIKNHPEKFPLNRVALWALCPEGIGAVEPGRIFYRPGLKRGRGGWKDAGSLKHLWARTCENAGVVDLHIHDLRHTAATWLQGLGVQYEVRQTLLGHSIPGETAKYSHGSPEFDAIQRDAMNLMAEKYDLTKGLDKSPDKSGTKIIMSNRKGGLSD